MSHGGAGAAAAPADEEEEEEDEGEPAVEIKMNNFNDMVGNKVGGIVFGYIGKPHVMLTTSTQAELCKFNATDYVGNVTQASYWHGEATKVIIHALA